MKPSAKIIPMDSHKRIVLVAHDNKKQELLEWARFNRDTLVQRELYATGNFLALLAELVPQARRPSSASLAQNRDH